MTIYNDIPWHDMDSSDELDALLSKITVETAMEMVKYADFEMPYLYGKGGDPLTLTISYTSNNIELIKLGEFTLSDILRTSFENESIIIKTLIDEKSEELPEYKSRQLDVANKIISMGNELKTFINENIP